MSASPFPECAGIDAEAVFERPCEGFLRLELVIKCDFYDALSTARQFPGSLRQSAPSQIAARGISSNRFEQSHKMKLRIRCFQRDIGNRYRAGKMTFHIVAGAQYIRYIAHCLSLPISCTISDISQANLDRFCEVLGILRGDHTQSPRETRAMR